MLRFGDRRFPCAIGRGGLRQDKREGDNATPTGMHRITACYYRPDRLARPCNWAVPIRPFDLWSDDVADPAYNRLVTAPHPFSHEALRRADRLYDIVLTTDWNSQPTVPGRGSAIFVHVWRRPRFPTAGCVALALPDLKWILQRIAPGTVLEVRPSPHPASTARLNAGRAVSLSA